MTVPGPFASVVVLLDGVNLFLMGFVVIFLIISARSVLIALVSGLVLRDGPSCFGRANANDLRLSFSSSLVFACVGSVSLILHGSGYVQLYHHESEWQLPFQLTGFLGVLAVQDAVFYFVHRLLHHPALYRIAHLGHHRSRHYSAWTSFAFDPIESLFHSVFIVVVAMTVPLHFVTLFALLVTMSVWAALNHMPPAGLPEAFPHHWLGRWLIGPVHHSIHHQKQGSNFGLYFTFWDLLFGTQDQGYARSVSRVVRKDSLLR